MEKLDADTLEALAEAAQRVHMTMLGRENHGHPSAIHRGMAQELAEWLDLRGFKVVRMTDEERRWTAAGTNRTPRTSACGLKII